MVRVFSVLSVIVHQVEVGVITKVIIGANRGKIAYHKINSALLLQRGGLISMTKAEMRAAGLKGGFSKEGQRGMTAIYRVGSQRNNIIGA